MEKLSRCVLGVAVLAIIAAIFCAEGNKAVAQTEPDLGRHIGWIGSQAVYKFNDGGNECYVLRGGGGNAISCTR